MNQSVMTNSDAGAARRGERRTSLRKPNRPCQIAKLAPSLDVAFTEPCTGDCGEMMRRADTMCSECEKKANARYAAEHEDEIRAQQLAAAGVPPRLLHPFVQPKVWPGMPACDLRAWTGRPWCAVLHGDPGTGKSFVAVELLARALSHSRSARWLRAGGWPALAFSGGDQDAAAYRKAGCLVLDDFGRGHQPRTAWNAVSELLYTRYDRELPTIITTNLTLDALAAADLALLDRLRDGWLIPVEGDSRRGSPSSQGD